MMPTGRATPIARKSGAPEGLLPLALSEENNPPMRQPVTTEPARLLVIDDEAPNLELMDALLTAAGYDVHLANGGRQGLRLARETNPALILLDVKMPDLSGYEVCTSLRTCPLTAGTPVLFVTALATPADRERAAAVGGDDFLAKPFQMTELLTRVEALLRGRQMQRAVKDA